MKSFLIAAALTSLTLPGSVFAHTLNESTQRATAPAPRPIPATVVKPTGLPLDFSVALINVEFTLDQAGKPSGIKVLSLIDPVLKRQLVAAFRQWRFEPGARDPASTQKRFVLPIELRAES